MDASRRRRVIENRVARYCGTEGLLAPGASVLVAASGGPDSSALLLILARLAERRSWKVKAAYFDHRLRGPEATAAETEAVGRLAAIAGVDLVCGGGDVRSLATEQHLSLEDAARRARYEFLGRAAAEDRAVVAVGHTRDDQAETVLLHILRGAGLQGLAGMAPAAPLPVTGREDVKLVRPLLALSRSETIGYCRDAGIEPLADSSNLSPAFLRNRVRNELLPDLARFNPEIGAALSRLAGAARLDLEYLEAEARRVLAEVDDGDGLVRNRLKALAPALRRHVLRQAVTARLGEVQGFGESHWVALDKAAVGPAGVHLNLPRSLVAEVGPERLLLRFREATAESPPVPEFSLPVPGEGASCGWRFAAGDCSLPDATASARVDASAAGRFLTLRSRRPGDRFQPLGLTGTKKLQDFFVDAHVPRAQRNSVPLFVTDRGIIWVGGYRIAEWARPKPDGQVLVLSYRGPETAR